MSDNPHLFEAAYRMIDRYGTDVLHQIDERIEELSHSENEIAEACNFWRQMRCSVVVILDETTGNPIQ